MEGTMRRARIVSPVFYYAGEPVPMADGIWTAVESRALEDDPQQFAVDIERPDDR
ncbi:MAG: hypothetical protein ACRDY1_01405 [Acidimicrobiales bacterium]